MLGLLGDEWSLLILQQSLMGATRYRDFMARLPISNSVLSSRLRTLTGAGMLVVDPSGAGRTGYLPTERARSLWPVLLCIWAWERTWVTAHTGTLPAMHHRDCGSRFDPVLRCAACGGPAGPDDVDLRAGPSGGWERSAPQASTRRRSDPGAPARQAGLFPETMAVFGNRWAAALLVATFLGASRFTQFQSQLGIPPSLLTERLQTFCALGVLDSAPAGGDDPLAYRLTDKGRALFGVLVCAQQWAQAWFRAPEGPALLLTHRCGAALDAELGCDGCGHRLRGAQVEVVDGVSRRPAEVGSP